MSCTNPLSAFMGYTMLSRMKSSLNGRIANGLYRHASLSISSIILGICLLSSRGESHGSNHYRHHGNRVHQHAVVRVGVDTTSVRNEWPYVTHVVKYPYVTGSTVLDLARSPWNYDRCTDGTTPSPKTLVVVKGW